MESTLTRPDPSQIFGRVGVIRVETCPPPVEGGKGETPPACTVQLQGFSDRGEEAAAALGAGIEFRRRVLPASEKRGRREDEKDLFLPRPPPFFWPACVCVFLPLGKRGGGGRRRVRFQLAPNKQGEKGRGRRAAKEKG